MSVPSNKQLSLSCSDLPSTGQPATTLTSLEEAEEECEECGNVSPAFYATCTAKM